MYTDAACFEWLFKRDKYELPLQAMTKAAKLVPVGVLE